MSSRLLKFSLGLNLLLLAAAGYWIGSNRSSAPPVAVARIAQKNARINNIPELDSVATAHTSAPAPLRWSELESEDYPTYIANLRKAGCPEPVLRRIIEAEIRELYAQKGFALVQEFHRDFWEIAARRNVREHFRTTLAPQVKALGREANALLIKLLGDAPPESRLPTGMFDAQWTDFLAPAKREQLRLLALRFQPQIMAVARSPLSPDEKAHRLAELRREWAEEQEKGLSPEEWEELQLRQSGAARELRQLHGVDFSEAELRNLAKAIDTYHRQAENSPEVENPPSLDQELQVILGPARFAELDRARSAIYRELYEVAEDLGQPQFAAEIFDLRLKAEKESEEIRADKKRTAEEKQALLDDLQDRVEHVVMTRFGPGAYQSYKSGNGRWINSLGRL